MRSLHIYHLGLQPYEPIWHQMQTFTNERSPTTPDALWFVEHHPVFTQGQAGKAEHLLNPKQIPVIQTDRGGQITYHGPGQMVAYVLIDIKRLQIGVRDLVDALELATVNTLAHWNIASAPDPKAPGVYVNGDKIASLGLKIRKGGSFHGLALNVNMDLNPFQCINPCGYAQMTMTQMRNFVPNITIKAVQSQWITQLCQLLPLEPCYQSKESSDV